METKNYYSPKGALITGTLETVRCRALIAGIEADGTPYYAGETEVFWDEQKTVCNEKDQIIFLCEDGLEWTFDQLTPAQEPGEEGEDA
jgi:hypothetical protein